MTNQPPQQPSGQPAEGSSATQRMPAAASSAAAPPAAPPKKVWHEATSTRGGRWAIAVAAGAVAVLMLLGVGTVGLMVLRHHDRFALMGDRRDAQSHNQRGLRDGRADGPRADRDQSPKQGMPGLRGGRAERPGGLGGALGGGALHGSVTATVNGSVQALVFQSGEVTAVSATSITLKSSDGFVGTYGRNASTKANGEDPTKGGQAFVLARAADKVALRTVAMPAAASAAPNS